MRVLVCGGRNYHDRDHVHNTLCKLHAERGPITCVIQGCASGADFEGMFWAQMMKIKHAPFEAEWAKYGKSAGMIRNRRMLEDGKPDLVVAFPGGKGTENMIEIAMASGVETVRIPPRG